MKAAKGDDEKISMITDHINQLLSEVSTLLAPDVPAPDIYI